LPRAAEPAVLIAARLPGRLVRRLARETASLSLLSRVFAGSAVLAILVAGGFTTLLIATSHLRLSTNEQAQSRDLTKATLGLERVVNQLEVSLRSFVISNADERFLSDWRQARADMPTAIGTVEGLIPHVPAQQRQIAELSAEIHAYIGEYGLPLIAIAHISPNAARSGVATRDGLLRIGSIRDHLSRLLADEDSLAAAYGASAKREAARAVRIGVAALVAAAGLLVLFGVFLARGVARPVRMVADGASQVARGDLSTRLAEGGAAEIDTLTRAFNAMARSLEQGKHELETQNEELRQSQRMMSQLVSVVSHELRTPLASIRGYTSVLLNRSVAPDDMTHYLEIVHEQGRRLEALVDEFLESERVQAGRIELKDEPLDLKPLLLAEAQLLSSGASNHRIEVEIASESLPVRGDRDRLAQVIDNLLTNAVKYSPEGGLVEVEAELELDAVRVRVRDQGLGVSEEHQARIFTKFFRGDARESGITGTGLGLAVSREIIEAHGGRIGFTSRAGSGSTFWFELPLADRRRPTVEDGSQGAERGDRDGAETVGLPGRL
jgi:signal transduction histidine kinase